MNLKLKLKFKTPIKTLLPITIPISSVVTYKVDIRIQGSCSCSIVNSVADVDVDLKLTTVNALVPNQVLNLAKDFIKGLILSKVIEPLKDNGVLLENEIKIDGKSIEL